MAFVYDQQRSFEGGQDSSFPPSRIAENQYYKGINVSTSKGVLRSRPGFDRKELKFPQGTFSWRFNSAVTFENLFRGGKFQALAPYQSGGNYYQVAVISGVIFMINQKTLEVSVLTTTRDLILNENADRINWSPAGRFLVLHDYPNRPVFVEGQSARRSDLDALELPVSVMGVYNSSRYFFANKSNEFSAGDVVGNEITPDAPITINEIVTGDFAADIYQAPSEYARPITAMARLQAVDSSTGIGQVLVATEKEIFGYNTVAPRADWVAGQFGTMLNYESGIIGPRAHTNVGSDLFYVSADGQLRSLNSSRDDQRQWSRSPLSIEVSNWVKYIAEELKTYVFLTYFNNMLLMGVYPYRIEATKLDGSPIVDVAFRGLVVLETDNIARFGTDTRPAWAGLWTGIRPMDMNVNDERLFAISKDYYSRNELYEIIPDLEYDRAGKKTRDIRSIVYTKDYEFEAPFENKELVSAEFALDNIKDSFCLELYWKPNHASEFTDWVVFNHEVPYKYTDICKGNIPQRLPASFRELKFGAPEKSDAGNPITKDLYETFRRVQLKIAITGRGWKLTEFRLTAKRLQSNATEIPELYDTAEVLEQFPVKDWDYEEFGV